MADPETNSTENRSLAAGELGSYLYILRNNPNFRRFWLSGIISQAGDWFNYIGIFVLLTRLTGSGEAISWFLIAKFIPTTILGPAAGVVADRFNRKIILLCCDLSRVLVVLGYLLVQEADQVYLIFILALVQESLWSFWHPARQAVLPDICTKEELSIANGLSGASWSVMLALGAAAGGFVSAVFGWQTAVLVDSFTFVVSASIMMTVTVSAMAKRKKRGFSLARMIGLHDLMEGIRYVGKHGEVAALLMVKSGWAMSGGILVLLTVFGGQVFSDGGRGGMSGVLYSMRGIGAAVGPILAWRIFGDGLQPMRRAIGVAFFISSLAYLFFSQAPNIVLAGLCVFVGHIGGSIQWIFSTTLLHRLVDPRFRGRVFAAEMALLTFVLSLSTWLTGMALDRGVDPRTIVVWLAVLFLLPGSCWLLYVYRLDQRVKD
ncbi:MAG: MFS transporter [Desulfobulbaceae bacterium]|nr:MFS transporter [Desulfobulbaceae bacterium]